MDVEIPQPKGIESLNFHIAFNRFDDLQPDTTWLEEMIKEAKGTKRDTEFLFDEEDEVIAPRKGRKSITTTGEPKKPRNMALAVQELQDKLAHMGDKLQENIQRLGHHAVCMQFMCSFFFRTHFVSRCCSHKESHKWRYSIETAAPPNACIAATINCTSG